MIKTMPKIPAATCYLDRDALTLEERGLRYARLLREEIERQGPESVLAFIMEPVGGASTGALVPPDSWYREIQAICDEYGILLITDEVMSGAGRTGRFLASEHWRLEPDIIAMAKGFAAGYVPLGAMAARRDIVEAVLAHGGFAHGYTYAGNPLACAAGNAVLRRCWTAACPRRGRKATAQGLAGRPDGSLSLHRRRAGQGPAARLRAGFRPAKRWRRCRPRSMPTIRLVDGLMAAGL